jgi:hypothetical protein
MIKVKMQAPMVPTGMAKLGFFKSPDMLAPAKEGNSQIASYTITTILTSSHP